MPHPLSKHLFRIIGLIVAAYDVIVGVEVAMQLHTLLILLGVHSAGTHVGVELWLVVLV
jgi:hypothetical protein